MSTRSERDKQKPLQERNQAILSALLKDEDNKYCVDCDAKGPRWASWNLGIFLCIRCAGIHRNLGVHITKVKSVNLDSWTSEQIAMMQEMGNSRARAVYEAELPDNYRRPQTDSGLEAFIRAKYESKKYIAKEWIPPQPKIQRSDLEEKIQARKPIEDDLPKKERKRNRPRPAATVNVTLPPSKSISTNSKQETKSSIENKAKSEPEPPKASAEIDLLGLDTPAIASESSNSNELFGEFMGSSFTAPPGSTTEAPQEVQSNGLSDISLFGEAGGTQGQEKKSTKESILALYGSGTSTGSNQQMFGVPGGMYMPQQAAGQMNMMGGMQNGMMGGVPQGNMAMMANVQGNAGMQQYPTEDYGSNLMVVDPMAEMQANMGGRSNSANYPFGYPYESNAQQAKWNVSAQGQVNSGNQYNGYPMQMQGMMMGQMGMVAPSGGANMMGQSNMYNMGNMYNTQQAQYQQMQNQMASMGINQAGLGGYPQPGPVAAGGPTAGGWGNQQSGQTLSNNLWQ